MRLYDRVNMKSVIIVTSLAAVISVAAGGIGGVPVGTLLIRALLFSLLFAVGTVLVNVIVDTYLPELKIGADESDVPEGESDESRGQNVNIVMDDEEDGSPVSYGEEGENERAATAGEGGSSRPREGGGELNPAANGGSPQAPVQNDSKALPDIGVFSSLADDEDEEEESGEPEEDATGPASTGGAVSSRYSAMQTTDEEKIDYFQNNTTAEELAKGVRTMLKSDEKG